MDAERLERIRGGLEPGSPEWLEATRRLAAEHASQCYTVTEEEAPACAEAADLYRQVLDSDQPIRRLDELLFDYGLLQMWLGESAQAAILWQRLLDTQPDSQLVPHTLLALGEYHFLETADIARAGESLQRAATFSQFKGRAYALYLLAWCYLTTQEFGAAMDSLVQAINADQPERAIREQALRDLPNFFIRAGQPAEAANFYREVARERVLELLTRTEELYRSLNLESEADLIRSLMSQEVTVESDQ